MRLVALLTAVLALPAAAQAARALPWEGLPVPPWQGRFDDPQEGPAPVPVLPTSAALRVRLAADGAFRVLDGRGVVRLRAGLPGRPLRVWRDGGVPVPAPWNAIPFPPEAGNPLFSEAFWAQADPRRGLAGLLWIQDDGERTLSLVHPATGKVAFLPLPEVAGVELRFLAAGLVAEERSGSGGRVRRWILPWVALAPALARLAPPAEPPKAGTALQPFPREKGF